MMSTPLSIAMVGTRGVPARYGGFETAIEKIQAIPDDATQDEMQEAAGDLSEAEKKDQESLSTYITNTCMGQLSPSESPSE